MLELVTLRVKSIQMYLLALGPCIAPTVRDLSKRRASPHETLFHCLADHTFAAKANKCSSKPDFQVENRPRPACIASTAPHLCSLQQFLCLFLQIFSFSEVFSVAILCHKLFNHFQLWSVCKKERMQTTRAGDIPRKMRLKRSVVCRLYGRFSRAQVSKTTAENCAIVFSVALVGWPEAFPFFYSCLQHEPPADTRNHT